MMHAQGGYQGLVADAGIDARINVTGWQLKAPGTECNTMPLLAQLGGLAF